MLQEDVLNLDYSKIPRHTNPLPPLASLGQVRIFTGLHYEAAQHVLNFMNFIADLSAIHEDVLMRLFVFTLRGLAASQPGGFVKSAQEA
jgi:hypothetical protein